MNLSKVLIVLCAGVFTSACLSAQPATASSSASRKWDSKTAAAYLDARITWWMDWPSAARDHGTFCVSCHTAVPYAIARPALWSSAGEHGPSVLERRLLDNVAKRVRMWKVVGPFYPTKKETDPKTVESRGTESILNALILARYDEATGKLSADARLALDNMWSEQLKAGDERGAWSWLQFHNSPWEGDSQYLGATLAAIAVGTAPGNYRNSPEIQGGLKLLSEYLVREQASQIPVHRAMLLWAAAILPGLLTAEQRKSIVDDTLSRQQLDGGFSLSYFVGGWKRRDNTPLDARSDGYATGLVVYTLRKAGVTGHELELKRGVDWLALNQQTEGNWVAWSLNKQRDPASDAGHFMTDAATAFAALALADGK